MLRCVRFSAQLKFLIDEDTFEALTRNAGRMSIVSGERIADELNKIMMTDSPSRGLMELHRSTLMSRLLPEIVALDAVETRCGKAHKNNFYHTLEVVDNISRRGAGLWLRWAALLHDVGKPAALEATGCMYTHDRLGADIARGILERLRYPSAVIRDNAVGWTFHNHNFVGAKMVPQIFRRLKLPMDGKMKYVQKLVDLHMRPIVIADDVVTDSAVRRLLNDAGDDIDDLMTLCEADITSRNSVRKQRFLDNFRIVREKIADLKERDYKRLLQPCIDGNEIMEMFSLRPSPQVGILKQTLKDAVLDNRVPNEREPLMRLLMEKAGSMGLL